MLFPPSEIDGKSLIIFHLFLNEILLRYASYLNIPAYQYFITQSTLGFLLLGRLAERLYGLPCFFAHFFRPWGVPRTAWIIGAREAAVDKGG